MLSNDKSKQGTAGGLRENSNDTPDYQEELKQAGIISKKFILKIGGNSGFSNADNAANA